MRGNLLDEHEIAHEVVETAAVVGFKDGTRAATELAGILKEEVAIGRGRLRLVRWRAQDGDGSASGKA